MALTMDNILQQARYEEGDRHRFDGFDTYAWEVVAQGWRVRAQAHPAVPILRELADEANRIALVLQLLDAKIGATHAINENP